MSNGRQNAQQRNRLVGIIVLKRYMLSRKKFYAVAAKRKWLFFIIAAAIVAYLVFSYTGVGSKIMGGLKVCSNGQVCKHYGQLCRK